MDYSSGRFERITIADLVHVVGGAFMILLLAPVLGALATHAPLVGLACVGVAISVAGVLRLHHRGRD